VNPFTRALAPPFIGRRRDFYIPKIPSSSKNIPNVNTYMNVFFISYIYKPATSSHSKPGLFETTTFTLLLNSSWIPLFAGSPRAVTSKSDFLQIPEFPVSRISWLHRFEIPDRRVFATPRLRRFTIPDHHMFATLRLRRFKIPDHRMFVTSGLRRFETPESCRCFAPCWRIKYVSLYDPQAYGPHTFFTTGFPRFLSICGARGLKAFDLLRHT
jgi:hypothetical protein